MKFPHLPLFFVAASILIAFPIPANSEESIEASLIGRWRIVEAEGKKVPDGEGDEFEFRPGGGFVFYEGRRVDTGTFVVSEDGKKLTVTREGDKPEPANIVSLKDGKLSLEVDGEDVVLAKIGDIEPDETAGAGEADELAEKHAALIIGKWKLESVEGKDLSENETSSVFEFNADRTMVRRRGDSERKGSFELSDDGKTVSMKREGSEKVEVFSIILLNGTTFQIDDDGKKVALRRLEEGGAKDGGGELEGLAAKNAELIVGKWRLESVEGEKLSDTEKLSVFVFEADGSLIRRRGDAERAGKYELSGDGKSLSMLREGSSRKEMSTIVDLDETILQIENDGKKVILRRMGKGEAAGETEDASPDDAVTVEKGGDGDAEIYGKWALVAVDGKEIPEGAGPTFELKEDGSLTSTKRGRERRGEFALSEDGKELWFFDSGSDPKSGELFEVVKIEESTLTLRNDGEVLTLRRAATE